MDKVVDPGDRPSSTVERRPFDPVLIILILLVLMISWGWIGRLFDLRFSNLEQLPGLLVLTGLGLVATIIHFQGRTALKRRRDTGEGREAFSAEALRSRLSFQEAILENSTQGLSVCRLLEEEPDPTFILWNRRMAELTGYGMEQVNTLGFFRALFPSPGPRVEARQGMLRLAAGEKGAAEEWTITRADGRQQTLSISIAPFKNDGEAVHFIQARGIDRKIGGKRGQGEASHRELAGRAPVALLGLELTPAGDLLDHLLNPGGKDPKDFLVEHPDQALRFWGQARIFEANRTALELFKANEPEEIGRSWPRTISPSSFAELVAGLAGLAAHGGSFQAEIETRPGEMADRRYYAHLVRLRDNGGSRINLLVSLTDITGPKRIQEELGREKDRLEAAARLTGLGIWEWEYESGRVFLDPGLKAILGYGSEETIDPVEVLKEILNPPEEEHRPVFPDHPDQTGRPMNLERRIINRDGQVRWLMIRGESVRGPDGRFERMVGTAADITGRRREEEVGQWSAAMVESAPTAMIGLTLEGLITSWNEKAEEVFGYSSTEIIGQHLFYLFPPERTSEATRTLTRLRAGERVGLDRSELLSGEGRRIHVSLSFFPIFNPGEGLTGAAFIARDQHPDQRIEDDLTTQQETLGAFLKASPVGVCRIRKQVLEWASPAFYKMLGYPEGTLKGMEVRPLYPQRSEYERVGRDLNGQLAAEGRAMVDTRWIRKDGRIINCHLESRLLDPADPDKGQVMAVMDLTDRTRAEEERAKLAAAVEQAKDLVLITDPEMKIVYVNPVAETTTGFSRRELSGRRAGILGAEELDSRLVREQLKEGRTWSGQVTFTHKNGTTFETELTLSPILDINGAVVNFIGMARDVTSELELRSQLRQAQKLEAIGTLAGGIAHDFNNILAGIMGYTELMMPEAREHPKLFRRLGEILKGSERAKNLIQQILTFSRQSETENKPVQVSLVAKEALRLLRASIPANVEIIRKINPDSGRVMSDPVKIHQVIINLCTNAAQAMLAKGGRLEVGLEDVPVDSPELAGWSDLEPGPYLKLWVKDDGPGIDPKVSDRIFDPYFTTKKPSEGTGLGLATVHGIVTECHGTIRVESQPGEGACFEILLPRVLAKREARGGPSSEVPTGTETILFVDDEATLVEMTTERLESLGYRVVGQTSPVEAWEIFRADPKRFDLVITDQTMPKMTGIELSLAIMGLRPELPVILCTGFSEVISPEKALDLGIKDFLYKPIVTEQMAKAVRKALDQAQKNL